MFSMSLGDVMPGGDDDSKREDGPSLDSTFEDLAPTEFLSPFVDDVDFVFPDGEMLEDISRPKRSRKDSASMDETGPEITQWKGSVDGSMFRKGHSFEGTGLSITPRGSGASASAAASGAADGGDDASGDKNVSTEHLEDLLAVLAARVAPVDESTAEIFDSDAEDDDDGERSDDVSHSQSDVESEAPDVKPQISQSGMPGPPNIMPMPVMDMSGSHAAFAFPKAEFDQLQVIVGSQSPAPLSSSLPPLFLADAAWSSAGFQDGDGRPKDQTRSQTPQDHARGEGGTDEAEKSGTCSVHSSEKENVSASPG